MKNLKYLDEFVNEGWYNDPTDNLNKQDKQEYETITEMIEEYLEEEGIGCSFDSCYFNKDGEKDLNGLKKYIEKEFGDTLDYFFKKYRKIIYDDINFTSKNGFYDYMLYTYDNSFPLNGGGVGPEPEDKLMKYYYGFQTTKLGRLFINQNFETIENFYKACADNFTPYLFNDILSFSVNYDESDYKTIHSDKYSICIINLKSIYKKSRLPENYTAFINKIEMKYEEKDKKLSSWATFDDEIFSIIFGDNIKIENVIDQYKHEIEEFMGHKVALVSSQEVRRYNL